MMAGRAATWALVGILGLGTAACGGAGPGARSAQRRPRPAAVSPFPSRESLTKLAAIPLAPAPAANVASASEWNVTIEASDAPSPAEARFAQVAVKGDSKLGYSAELRCVARELARFQVEHGAPPNERLKRFMIAACGVTNPGVSALVESGDAPLEISDERLLAQWQKTLVVAPQLRGNQVGVWMARSKKRVVIMTAFAKLDSEMVVSKVDASGVFTVRGAAPKDTEVAVALVNQGAGVTSCEADPSTPLPLFAFRCQMAAADQTAWVEVAARAHERLLLRSTGLALVRRDAAAPLGFVAAARAARPVTSPSDFRQALLEGVNRARTGAQLKALGLAEAQTTTNERLAPHFFDASFKSDRAKGDLVGLGLIAGWEIEGTIKRGELFSALLSGTSDANDWLDFALEVPMGRFALLDADAQQIAIGAAVPSDVGGLGAVVTTYDMFTGNDHRADTALVFQQIARARAARGLPPPRRIDGVPEIAAEARLVNERKRDVDDALDAAMVAVRDRAQKSVRGWVLTTNQLAALAFPPELLGAGPLDIAVEVTHSKEPGAAWGSYVVFMVTPSAVPATTPVPGMQATGFRPARTPGSSDQVF